MSGVYNLETLVNHTSSDLSLNLIKKINLLKRKLNTDIGIINKIKSTRELNRTITELVNSNITFSYNNMLSITHEAQEKVNNNINNAILLANNYSNKNVSNEIISKYIENRKTINNLFDKIYKEIKGSINSNNREQATLAFVQVILLIKECYNQPQNLEESIKNQRNTRIYSINL